MPAIYGPARRREIRGALAKHMKDYRISRAELARHINSRITDYSDVVGEKEIKRCSVSASAIGRFLDDDPESDKVSHDKVATLEAYLLKLKEGVLPTGIQSQKIPAVTSIFLALLQFLKIDVVKVAPLLEEIKGDWALYNYSDRDRDRVVRGAIRFDVNASGECIAYELQTAIPIGRKPPNREEHSGHFMIQGNSLIVLLLNDKVRPLAKFYILHIEGFTKLEGKKDTMTGALVKVGEGKDVFTSIIHMTRRDTAFHETAKFPISEISNEIIAILESDEFKTP